ncbi:MAG: B12-binding domain-containing radical SAM protein, partial [Actinobacteria bacterium]
MTRTDLWPRLEPLLARVERPARYIGGEWGARVAEDPEYRVALVYPDTYEIGQANQAIAILYDKLNGVPGVAAERVYLPWLDLIELMRAEGLPLFSLETTSPLSEFDLIGITLPYELSYSNVLEVLDLAGIPLRSALRGEDDPL